MDSMGTSLVSQTNGQDSTLNLPTLSDDLHILNIHNHSLLITELEALRALNQDLQLKLSAKNEECTVLQQQKDETLNHNFNLTKDIELVSRERNWLYTREEELVREKEEIYFELEVFRERIKELLDENGEKNRVFSENFGGFKSVKECLFRVIEKLGEGKVRFFNEESEEMTEESRLNDELGDFLVEVKGVSKLVSEVELKLSEDQEREMESRDEKNEHIRILYDNFEGIKSVKECLIRLMEKLGEEKDGIFSEKIREELRLNDELGNFLVELKGVSKLVSEVELKLSECQEKWKKEKRELENSVVSLTEENRDINSLFRIALVEKEAVEKSLNRLKGNNEQKRGAILQIAGRGLQKVGFGFMMGAGANEPTTDNSVADLGGKSDANECEEEIVNLASTVEWLMKNLRLEITQLRRSLEESRSDTERLQTLTEKQAQRLAENTLYMKELEDREMMLAQNVEELLMEIKEIEEEVARWREACELEVEAGKSVVEEHNEVVAILKRELEKTKAALLISNGKLKLKDELADAAMGAQAAAERSLQLADNRAAQLRGRTEELTRQLETAEKREHSKRPRIRHICWPWPALKLNHGNSTNTNIRSVKWMVPEMQALLH